MTQFIVDLSHYQGGFRVADLPGQGVSAVILKATEGMHTSDGMFRGFLAEAQGVQMLAAAYHYLTNTDDAGLRAQAANTRSAVRPDVPVWIDVEAQGATRAQAYIYADELRRIGGTVKGIYNSTQPAREYGWWRARYPSRVSGSPAVVYAAVGGDDSSNWGAGTIRHPDIWQFTADGRFPGENYAVDISAYRGTLAQLINTGWFWTPTVSPPPQPPEISSAPPGGTMRVVQIPPPDNRAFVVDGGHTYISDPTALAWLCRAAGQLLDPTTGKLWTGDPNDPAAKPFTIKVPGSAVDLLPGGRDAVVAANTVGESVQQVLNAVTAAAVNSDVLANKIASVILPEIEAATGVSLSDDAAQKLAQLVIQYGFASLIQRLGS